MKVSFRSRKRNLTLYPLLYSAFDLLHYKDVDMARLTPLVPGLHDLPLKIIERLGIEGLYKQHIIRQVSRA